MVTAEELIEKLGLKPHKEGGWFAEVYRAPEKLAAKALPPGYPGARSLSTAIHYLITPKSFSRLHRLRSDEIFHFYLGDPVEFLLLSPEGKGKTAIVGPDIASGQRPLLVVPRGTWQGARLVKGGKFALLGTTMAPGFEYDDYEQARRSKLVEAFPAFEKIIGELSSS